MKKWQRLLHSLLAIAFLACGVASAVSVSQQVRQDRLDRALIRAVKGLDAPSVDRLLTEGANAKARDTGEPPLGPAVLIKRAIARLQRDRSACDECAGTAIGRHYLYGLLNPYMSS